MIRVLIVDDHSAFRTALAYLLEQQPNLEVAAQAGTCAEAREAILEGRFDVAVLDLAMPDGDGSMLIGEARRVNPGAKVLVLSATLELGQVDKVREMGADAVLNKVEDPRRIAEEIRALASGTPG
jgi:two-component system response regulator DesR